MYVTVKYKDHSSDNICLGMDAQQIKFNGKPVLIENELIYLLRANSGYYSWLNEENLTTFSEYKDFYKK